MAKRKFIIDDDEDEQDQDYQSHQDSDDDYEPASGDQDTEYVSIPTLRVTQSRSALTASASQNRDNEGAQGESGDGGVSPTLEDNTPEVPPQSAAEFPQAPTGNLKLVVKVFNKGDRIMGPTKYCGVVTPRIKDPESAVRGQGEFICVICGSRFTRVSGVNFHFISCVEKFGNPRGNRWWDHPSCAPYLVSLLSSANPNDSGDTARTQPVSHALPAKPPATRSKRAKTTSETQRVSQPTQPNGPRATRSKPVQTTSETQPGFRSALPTGPRETRSRTTQTRSETQAVSQPAQPTEPRATRPKPGRTTSETQPGSGTGSTKTSSTSKQTASNTSTARPKPTKPAHGGDQRTSNPTDKQKREPQTKKATVTGEQTKARKAQVDESLPPLSGLDDIFDDIVVNAMEKTPLTEAMENCIGKTILVATMCSGTESPLLAMGRMQNRLLFRGKPGFNIKHVFSAEIVPYKQAYIERNFHPDKLFRDIREIAVGGQATTAYGALTDVPKDVDLLIAGFSCVDFSKLNKKAKKLTDIGESGDTFRAILEYAKQYRPAVILLENVDGAPWDLIRATWEKNSEFIEEYFENIDGGEATAQGFNSFWDDDDPGYSAGWQRVDSKNYYIPQTRIRRYMICVDRLRCSSVEEADDRVRDWKTCMVALERKASVSIDAFLLTEDDPRLQCAKDEMSKIGKPRQERDWEVCHGRHEAYRAKEKLGTLRPILNWTNDGSAKVSSYIWPDWTLKQPERIWDSIEISYLRNAAKGIDSFHKTRVWELSQNIDRFTDNSPTGIVGCLTPKGQPFSTTRGGPVTGRETIALQGLPIDELLLTRESENELYDLAGNAMTATVVGAGAISVLAVCPDILTGTKKPTSQPLDDAGSHQWEMRYSELQPKQVLKFDGSDGSYLDELCNMAKASVRLCDCEGRSLTVLALIRKCKCCHHHCCEKCGNMPKHDYELLWGNGAPLRTEPQEFQKRLRHAIPTRLEIGGFSAELLEGFAQLLPNRSDPDWTLFSEAILLASKQEYRFESARRSHCWKITYNAAHSRLELVFDQEEVYWLLYGKPGQSEPGNSRVRKLLDLPLARLTVRGKTMRGEPMTAEKILEGSWEISLPISRTFSITVTPQGELTDSWEKKLGLQGDNFIDKQVYTSLHVAHTSDPAADLILDHDICGVYDLLENCGTACSSLHKKRPTADAHDAPSLFLLLNADRIGPPDHDCYVFSTDTHRLAYGESRYVAAKIDSKWRPPYQGLHPRADHIVASEAECTVSSRWESCPISLRPHEGLEDAYYRFPKGEISMPVFGTNQHLSTSSAEDIYGCLHDTSTTALLSCEIPGQLADSVGWHVGRWRTMDQKSERQTAAAFAWLFARVKDLGDFGGDWRPLDSPPRGYQRCVACAPEPPKIMWTCSRNTKTDKIIPYEDGREAGEFERKIKARPAPFLVQTYIDGGKKGTGQLLVGLNLPTLVHRALARLGNIADSDDVEIKWRLDTQYEVPTRYKLREFTLANNERNLEANYAFPTGEMLRPEQKRSLQWMIGQEADNMAFYEEEIEEATLPQLGWRAEVRVRRTRNIRGGILADEVGYGKTATTLALIDAQEKSAEEHAKSKRRGCIPVKATLILVPSHLVHQWIDQVRKFLGINHPGDSKLLVIEDVSKLGKISVGQIKEAVIVIVSWKVLSSPAYMARMSHFAALPQGPSSGERETDAWLTRACKNIDKHMGELVNDYQSPKDFAAILKSRLKAAHTDKDILRSVPTQRLKGAKYTSWNPADCVTPVDPSPKDKDLNGVFMHMTKSDCTDLNSMTGTLLHDYFWPRKVVDEVTYVDEGQKVEKLASQINTIPARARWVLSGTPNIQDFGDVHILADFLAYNLGAVDDAAGVVKGATIRNIREDRTAAEQFRAYGFSHTAAWHVSRQAHAQRFLDKYASKNVAEIGVIKSTSILCPHFLGAAETVVNAELQQQLQSTEMKIVLRGKSKKDNDRIRRYRELLKGCKTAPECLLRSCSYFELGDAPSAENKPSRDAMDIDDDEDDDEDDDATDSDDHDTSHSHFHEDSDELSNPATATVGACEAMITIREKQMDSLIVELEGILLHAAWLDQQCGRAVEVEHRGFHYRQWKSEVEGTGLRDPESTIHLRFYLGVALDRVNANTEEMYYRDPPNAEDLKKEKKAADERKKQEKAKRTADRQAKNAIEGNQKRKASKKSKATARPDEDSEEMAVSDNETVHAHDEDPNPADSKPTKIRKDDFATYASVLRSLTGHLRSLAVELTSRTRSLRFARGAQELQQWYTDPSKPPSCDSCMEVAGHHEDLSINIRCGHVTCKECIQKTNLVICAVDGCLEGSESHCMRKAVDLVGDGESWEYGARVGSIIELINGLPEDEQILLFVQFEDTMLSIASALDAAGISNHALSKKAGRRLIEMMNDFQENHGEDKKRVLLLNPSNETAAGINLTNANHIIFASPLLTNTQQAYNASSTQCIGRAKRYGQQKTVHVYRFLAVRTIDVDILQEREQKTLVKEKKKGSKKGKAAAGAKVGGVGSSGEWSLVGEDEIDDTVEAGWGSGFNFKSNPTEED